MKQNTKKILTFSVLALFMTMFAMQFVMAAPVEGAGALEEGAANSADAIKDWFTKWGEGEDFSPNVAKYLFWALISMMVYSVVGKIPGFSDMFKGKKEWMGAVFSIIVGFLSMAYITPTEVYTMMVSYTAMGFVLGAALPFIILLFFTITLASESSKESAVERYGKRIIAIGIWVAFTIFIGIKALGADSLTINSGGLYWIAFIVGIIITISISKIFKKVRKEMEKIRKERSEENTALRKLQAEQEIELQRANTEI